MDTDTIDSNKKCCKICGKPTKRFSSDKGVYCSKECYKVIVI